VDLQPGPLVLARPRRQLIGDAAPGGDDYSEYSVCTLEILTVPSQNVKCKSRCQQDDGLCSRGLNHLSSSLLSANVKIVDRIQHLTTDAVPIIRAGLVTEVVDVVFSTDV